MRSTARLTLLLAALPGWLAAQSTPDKPAPAATPLVSAPQENKSPAPATTSAPRRSRAISPDVAAALAATAPKYAPPPPKPPEPKPEENPDLRETDKPKNGIIRLPKYIVREARPPVFRERDITTQAGLGEIARSRYLSELDRSVLNRWSILGVHSLDGDATTVRALQMYADEERLKNMSDMADRANMIQKSDAASGLYIKRAVDDTFMRRGDFGWQGGSPTKNAP